MKTFILSCTVDSRSVELAVEAANNVRAHEIALNWLSNQCAAHGRKPETTLSNEGRFRVDTIREVYCLRDTASRPDEMPEEDTVRHLGDDTPANWEDGRTWDRESAGPDERAANDRNERTYGGSGD